MGIFLIIVAIIIGFGIWCSKNKDNLDAWEKEAKEKKKEAQQKREADALSRACRKSPPKSELPPRLQQDVLVKSTPPKKLTIDQLPDSMFGDVIPGPSPNASAPRIERPKPVEVMSFTDPGTFYSVDTERLTCTCPDFHLYRKEYYTNDPRRLCKHLIRILVRQHKIPALLFPYQSEINRRESMGAGFPNVTISTRSSYANFDTDEDVGDAWEGTFREGVNAYDVKAYLHFDYVDGNGSRTTRSVLTYEADDVLGMIMAHCELRDATRTFRYDRMSNCVDLETGEVIDDIGSHLYEKYLSSPEYSILKFTEENIDLIKCLLYIGKADGQMRKEERDIILNVCQSSADGSLDVEKTVTKLLNEIQVPSIQAFKLAVGRIASKNHDQFRVLARAASDIVNTQKTIHPSEQAALDYISKKASAVGVAL